MLKQEDEIRNVPIKVEWLILPRPLDGIEEPRPGRFKAGAEPLEYLGVSSIIRF